MANPQNHRPIAKLSSPTVGNIFPRTRLFQLWDKESKKGTRIHWLSAPGGSGKTLSVVDYLRQHKLPTVWYQLDEGDDDLASFFHYLGQAVNPEGSEQLPALTPEYMLGLPVFTRNYFRALSKHLKTTSVIVFDNYQDLPDAAALHELLPIGIAELRADITVMILSRSGPPASFARWRVHGELRLCDWERLRLTEEENTGVCQFLKGDTLTAETVQALYDRTKGWITGLVLLLESDQPLANSGGEQDIIFDYFAHEIFSHAEPAKQDLLLQMAVLPEMTMDSIVSVTGNNAAQLVIEDLCRRNFFITKLAGTPVHYRFHPLFQKYLLDVAQQRYSPAEYEQLLVKSADALCRAGRPELAIPLYTEGKHEQQASEQILQVAQSLHEQGRDATLREWILRLPKATVTGKGWLQYWLGQTFMATDPEKALDRFEKAYLLFAENYEIDGQYRAISGGCRSLYISQRVQTGQDVWIQRFVELENICSLTSVNTDTADVLANVLLVMHWRDPTNKYMLEYLVEAERIWAETANVDKRLNLGVTLTTVWMGIGKLQVANSLLQQQNILAEQAPRVSLSVLWHYMYLGFMHCFAGQLNKSQAASERALELAEESGIHVADLLLLAVGTYTQLILGRLDQADHYLDRMQRILASLPLNLDAAHYHTLRGWRYLWEGNAAAACLEAKKGLDIAEEIGAKYPLSLCRYGMAHAHIANGDYDQAQSLLQQTHCPFGDGTYRRLDYEIALAEAYIAILVGNRLRAMEKIKLGMQIAIEDGYGPPLWGYPDFLLPVFELALEERVEVPYVQKLIRTAHLSPSPETLQSDNWPYPLKIHTLGCFSILKEDQALKFKGKSQKRPLGLLKALIAFGGRKVAEEKLNAALWPDADGDTAHQSFTTTLHRLRGLIGSDVVVLQEGALSLDPRSVWVDTWVFERLLGQIDHAIQQQTVSTEQIQHDIHKAMALYQGHFLEQESEDAWALSLRERLRSRWLRTIKNSIHYLGHQGHCSLAIDLYQQALELDSLAEELYRGLMGCYAAQDQYAEALSVYEKCRKFLSTVLSIAPSEATEHLYQAIQTKDKAVLSHICDHCK